MTPISNSFTHLALRRCDEGARETLEKVHPLWERAMAGEGMLFFEKTADKKRTLVLQTEEGTILERVELSRSILLWGKQYWIVTKYCIGSGSETNVRLCYEPSLQAMVARKKASDPVQETWLKRLVVSPLLGIIPILAVNRTSKNCYFYEQCATGSLERLIRKTNIPTASKPALVRALVEILSRFHALTYAEIDPNSKYKEEGLIHGDIKPANILYSPVDDSEIVLQLTDFGGINPDVFTGTTRYASPECFAARFYQAVRREKIKWGQAADMWALGITSLEILLGRLLEDKDLPSLYRNRDELQIRRDSHIKASLTLPSIKESEFDNEIFKIVPRESVMGKFISSALTVDWKQRITAKEALRLLSSP